MSDFSKKVLTLMYAPFKKAVDEYLLRAETSSLRSIALESGVSYIAVFRYYKGGTQKINPQTIRAIFEKYPDIEALYEKFLPEAGAIDEGVEAESIDIKTVIAANKLLTETNARLVGIIETMVNKN